jgi:hypothetical protein
MIVKSLDKEDELLLIQRRKVIRAYQEKGIYFHVKTLFQGIFSLMMG